MELLNLLCGVIISQLVFSLALLYIQVNIGRILISLQEQVTLLRRAQATLATNIADLSEKTTPAVGSNRRL